MLTMSYRFLLQSYKKYLNYANILAIIFHDKTVSVPVFRFSFVVPNSDVVAGGGEGRPRDVEPAGTGQQLVGIVAGAEAVHQTLQLLRVRCVATF